MFKRLQYAIRLSTDLPKDKLLSYRNTQRLFSTVNNQHDSALMLKRARSLRSLPCSYSLCKRAYFLPIFKSRNHPSRKYYSTNTDDEGKRKQDLVEAHERPQGQLTVGAKVVQAGKDVSYFGVILVGIAITGGLLWYTFRELFLGFSPNKIYSKALTKVKNNSEVIEFIGTPIKGYGEETGRGRRRHVSHQSYIVNGENYMRLQFYVKGSKRQGTVHVDVKQIGRGNYETRFIFVELTGFPSGTIIVEDNR